MNENRYIYLILAPPFLSKTHAQAKGRCFGNISLQIGNMLRAAS